MVIAKEPNSKTPANRINLPKRLITNTKSGAPSKSSPYRSMPANYFNGSPSKYLSVPGSSAPVRSPSASDSVNTNPSNSNSSALPETQEYLQEPDPDSQDSFDQPEESEPETEDRFNSNSRFSGKIREIAKARAVKSSIKATESLVANRAFYWLLGLIVPTFGLSILGLNILLIIPKIKRGLKTWQKISIIGLDLAILALIFILVISFIYFVCVVKPYDWLKPIINSISDTCKAINQSAGTGDNPQAPAVNSGQVQGDFYIRDFSPRGQQ